VVTTTANVADRSQAEAEQRKLLDVAAAAIDEATAMATSASASMAGMLFKCHRISFCC
jgi:hypothetical protein